MKHTVTKDVLMTMCLYLIFCAGVEVYNGGQFTKANNILQKEFAKEHPDFNLTHRCLAVEHDLTTENPFNLAKSVQVARTDFLTKEGCK